MIVWMKRVLPRHEKPMRRRVLVVLVIAVGGHACIVPSSLHSEPIPTVAAGGEPVMAGHDAIPPVSVEVANILKQLDKLGISQETIRRFFAILHENHVSDDALPVRLDDIAQRHLDLLYRRKTFLPEVPENIQRLKDVKDAIQNGDDGKADTLLAAIEQAEAEAAEKAPASANRHRRAEAGARAERGRLSAARFDHRTAARHFQEAAALLPTEDEELHCDYLTNSADALQDHGTMAGDNGVLLQAIDRYREALPRRDRLPDQWARIQNNLGNTLLRLGERERGVERLEEAATALRNALLEYTRARAPQHWAGAQNNLGNTLLMLGEWGGRPEGLVEAVSAYRSALMESPREHVPLKWAARQNNLGIALFRLGEQENGPGRLEEAATAHRNALLEYTRERVPSQWAATQHSLGTVLFSLGKRENGTKQLEEAVNAFRNALLERSRERTPFQWAATQYNLGHALLALSNHENGTERLKEAIGAYRCALLGETREQMPIEWAKRQNSLGISLGMLAEKKHDAMAAREATEVFDLALSVFIEARASHFADATIQNLARAHALVASLTR